MATTAAGAKQRGLANVNRTELRDAIGNMVHTLPVIAIDSDKNDLKTTNATVFSIAGLMYSKAAFTGENVTITSSDDGSTNQATGTTAYYVLGLDSSGNVTSYKGKDDETAFLPAVPSTICPFAVLKVVNASGAVFTQGTEDYDASGLTTTYTDISVMPVSPP